MDSRVVSVVIALLSTYLLLLYTALTLANEDSDASHSGELTTGRIMRWAAMSCAALALGGLGELYAAEFALNCTSETNA